MQLLNQKYLYVYHLSDDTNHDDVMTEQVLCGIIESQSKVIESGRLLLWVDNCSTQYKSGYVFKIFLKLAQKYNVRIDFFYGEAGHGRGLVDAMARFGCKGPQNQSWQRTSGIALLMKWWNISKRNLLLTKPYIPNCVWMNKNSSPKSMMNVYLSWRIMFDMVCEPL